MLTQTKQQISIEELSALYDRIYDIADRLFKKYNPCNIRKLKNNHTVCNGHKVSSALCCYECSSFSKTKPPYYWKKGCTIKCLGCKLFTCEGARKGHPILNKRLGKLRDIADKYQLPHNQYYLPKEKWLKHIRG